MGRSGRKPPRPSVAVGKSGEVEKQFDWADVEVKDDNMLLKLEWPRLQREFLGDLQSRTDDIKRTVTRHVCPQPGQQCTVAQPSDWLCGSFNVCVPIRISGLTAQRLLIKCPLPHRLGGPVNPRLLDEKLRCEAPSFAWISRNCPRVLIPRLWGFGLPNGPNVGVPKISLKLQLTLNFSSRPYLDLVLARLRIFETRSGMAICCPGE